MTASPGSGWLTRQEARTLASSLGVVQSVSDAIYLMTTGWADYFAACLEAACDRQLVDPTEVVDQLRSGPHLRPLVAEWIDRCSDADLEIARIAATFGHVPVSFLESLGGVGVIARLEQAGLPVVSSQTGVSLLPPFEKYLAPTEKFGDGVAQRLGDQLVASCGAQRACQILVHGGYTNIAAVVLSKMDPHAVDESSQESLAAILTTILDVEKDDGSLGLLLARVHHNLGNIDIQRNVLDSASQAAREQLRLDLAVEAEAELLMVDLSQISHEDARKRLVGIVTEAREHATGHALIRIRELHEALLVHSYDLTAIYRSVSRVEAVANQWKTVGESSRAAATLRMLASTSLTHLGEYALGAERMREACELVPSSPQALLRSLSLRCRMSALAGDIADYEVASAAAKDLCEAFGYYWLDAYFAWSSMIAASHSRNLADVDHHLRKARGLLDTSGLMGLPTGVVFWSDAARSLASCGELARARQLLDEVKDRRADEPLEYALADFVIMCRSYPERCSEFAESLFDACEVPVARQWAVDLELAFAAGSNSKSARLRDIRSTAAEYGLLKLCESLEKSHSDLGSPTVFLRLFGSFEIEVEEDNVPLTSKRATELLSLLAVHGKPVHNEVVVDHLWPDAPLDVGMKRLRNVVKRARLAVGDEGVVRSADAIGLGPFIRVDLQLAESLLREFESSPQQRIGSLVEAVKLYRYPLLDELLYSDWASALRVQVANRFIRATQTALESGFVTPTTLLKQVEYPERTIDPELIEFVTDWRGS